MKPTYIESDAIVSSCMTYRYRLWRRWGRGACVCFVMLNPSTADGTEDDPTIRRCVGFARSWGYDGIEVVNLHDYRATDPRELKAASKRGVFTRGPYHVEALVQAMQASDLVVAAWGAKPHGAGLAVHDVLSACGIAGVTEIHALRLTKGGDPAHPLYLPASLTPKKWREVSHAA